MDRQTDRRTLRKCKGFRIFSSCYENLKNRDTHRLNNPLNGFLSVNLRVVIIANTQTVIVHLGRRCKIKTYTLILLIMRGRGLIRYEFRLSNCVVALPNLDFHDHFVSVVSTGKQFIDQCYLLATYLYGNNVFCSINQLLNPDSRS